ncbi:hypothetical protein BCON_1007g00010 [Botryotinia convoluta]|uniref:Retroviral polymerase SH3-like domain-containing protein n=1 Tax=Botryotinia convoluta TaxID=54673 RepID=A0A4Z1H8C6_9HELO|nr:hypothetical protein BCON_1007g00010 [Botryotinia convoluta]
MDFRARKGILIGFDSSNNYLVYIPANKRVISSRDVDIQEDLIYSHEYENQDLNLLEEESPDFEPIQDSIKEYDPIDTIRDQTSPKIIEIDESYESEDETLDTIVVDTGEFTPAEPEIRNSKRKRGLIPENKGLDTNGKNG